MKVTLKLEIDVQDAEDKHFGTVCETVTLEGEGRIETSEVVKGYDLARYNALHRPEYVALEEKGLHLVWDYQGNVGKN